MVSLWSLYPELLWFIPIIDNIINSLTTYLMIGRNRQWNKKIYYYVIEALCCKSLVFSHQRLSKDNSGSNLKSPRPRKSQFETNMHEMVHGDIHKINTRDVGMTPEMMQPKQRLSTFVSEVELKWKSDDELYAERNGKHSNNSSKQFHNYTASDAANINVASLNAYIMKMKSVTHTFDDNENTYTVTNDDDGTSNHTPREPAISVVTPNETNGHNKKKMTFDEDEENEDVVTDNDDIGTEEDEDEENPVITHLITMEEEEVNIKDVTNEDFVD